MSKKSALAVKEIGEKVRFERKAQRLSQTQLAEIAGVSLNFVSQLERGKNTARLDKACDVLHALGLEIKLVYRNVVERKKR